MKRLPIFSGIWTDVLLLGLLTCILSLLSRESAHADRIVLAPTGDTLPENSFKLEFAISPRPSLGDQSRVAYSSGDGIELEWERLEAASEAKKRYSFNIQYPLPTLQNFPAFSVGIRDLTGTGTEHGALYLAGAKTIPLNKRTKRFFKNVAMSVGAGTGQIGGLFAGVQTHLTAGVDVYAEIYRHRPNLGFAVPLVRNLQARAYSLNGDIFYGVSYHWTR